jgi:arabinofuranosyltransferase
MTACPKKRSFAISCALVPLLRAVLLILAAWLIWRNAWVSDDAAITLRTVLNLLTGHGARFNIDERVQAYTHPLWFGLLTLSTAIMGNAFLAAAWLGIVMSVALLGGLLWLADNPWQGLLAAGMLLASMAFMEFSTSGLENPLSHLLILTAAAALIRIHGMSAGAPGRQRWLRGFFLCTGLLYLSRPDLVLLLAPCALQLLALRDIAARTRIRALLWAAVPVLIWTAFSLLYYGFPFPNTAYAKLGTGIAEHALWRQGLHYLGNMLISNPLIFSVQMGAVKLQPLGYTQGDPLTLFVSVLALLLAPWVRRWGWGWALGVALYLVYVVSIGGDFMAGRFFTAPMLAGAIVLARARLPSSRAMRLLTLGLLTLAVPVLAWKNIHAIVYTAVEKKLPVNQALDIYLIADERSFYFGDFALATITAPNLALFRPGNYRIRVAASTTPSIFCGGLGYNSIRGGPGLYLIDICALADPLLARLPIAPAHPSMRQMAGIPDPPGEPTWRIGHFERVMPAGYPKSIEQDANLLSDPTLHACYERIRRITRAPLLDGQRLRDIVRVNLIGAGCRAS